jgi:hypothetical protein
MDGIEIKGIELLTEEQKWAFSKEIEKYKEKLKWKTKSDFILKIVLKEYAHKADDKDTKRKRYSIQAQIKGQTHSFEANAEDWDFNKLVHKIFEKLINEVEHAYHSSEQKNTRVRMSRE